MATEVRHRRGTTAQHASFTGAQGEITVDTTKKTSVVHDGVTPGGFPALLAADVAGKANSGANSDITSLSGLTTPLSIPQGGTGAITAAAARTALGAQVAGSYAASGANNDITSLAAVTAGGYPALSVTPANLAQKITLGTPQATTSGSTIDFTSIPSWVKRITVMFSGMSTNGVAPIFLQIGDSGGVETTGYISRAAGWGGSGAPFTTGFGIVDAAVAAQDYSGQVILSLLSSTTNTWTSSGLFVANGGIGIQSAGGKSLSATLDRVRLLTSDTFDAGVVNILYEG